jgi:hypothetical protein
MYIETMIIHEIHISYFLQRLALLAKNRGKSGRVVSVINLQHSVRVEKE